ncbi:MAG TPA: ATP synthase F0 subunit B [Polyangiaceae bacterium LLY-WYZ-15_(1-7)]|nr:hypothetical protein [Sandaracinus sp.]HJL00625.1 ATP synthase F0 subunit B [Polyangiaceae bacterium LLY-WYZ-15_(1-7)]HJL13175.1 ATP synthase F0 subunit B [Polyangiaceae bacterium LLY-WYZ-15_(1-7)]HJL25700.1 ATP synthase F0 subunit B [Polyangiaceae bacterium LLY-WYZ-15_(1-7)]HJL35703.1 ATP synthase F0 subunit B [Polyangiaceae bacterium LLY-WYZ-15_(1-7)]
MKLSTRIALAAALALPLSFSLLAPSTAAAQHGAVEGNAHEEAYEEAVEDGLQEDGHGEHAAEHGDAHAEGHGGHGPVTIDAIIADPKFRASIISFFILLFVLVYFGRKAVRRSLENRKREIEEAINEAQQIKAEAEAKRQEFEERLAQLDGEIETVKTEMRAAAEAERDRIVADAEAKAALMRKDTQFRIEQRMKQLREDLTREAVEAAVAAAEEILGAETKPQDQQRLADAYLDELGKVAAASAQEAQS